MHIDCNQKGNNAALQRKPEHVKSLKVLTFMALRPMDGRKVKGWDERRSVITERWHNLHDVKKMKDNTVQNNGCTGGTNQ